MRKTTAGALATRIILALVTRTFFQPDEYFQSLEVAHHLVFGYGHLTWEWLSDKPIRSILYPGLNVPIFLTLKWLRLDDTKLLVGECRMQCREMRRADTTGVDLGT